MVSSRAEVLGMDIRNGLARASILGAIGAIGCSELPVCDRDGCDGRTIRELADVHRGVTPYGLAGGPDAIYWLDQADGEGSGTVNGVRKVGGPSFVIAGGQPQLAVIAADAAGVYWTRADGMVLKAPHGGGEAAMIGSGLSFPVGIEIDGGTLFAAMLYGETRVVTMPTQGGPLEDLVTDTHDLGMTQGFALNGTHVFWATWNSTSTLWSMPRDGGTPKALATSPSEYSVLAADEARVFWGTGVRLLSIPVAGGTPTVLVDATTIDSLAVDATHVYFSTDNRVARIPKGGGSQTAIAAREGLVTTLVLDETNVYWTTANFGQQGQILATEKDP
jgi:hypothetical protein